MRVQVEEVPDVEVDVFELDGGDLMPIPDPVIEEGESKGKYLSIEQERELVRRYQETGDEDAMEQLLDNHENYLIDTADKYHKLSGVDKNDLIQQAKLGLMIGVRKFNLDKYKTKILTYAAWWVKCEVQRYASLQRTIQGRPVNLTEEARELFKRHKTFMEEHKKTFGQEPLTESQQDDLEKNLGCTLGELLELKALYYAPGLSLNKPLSRDEDQNTAFIDVLPDERGIPLDGVERQSDAKYARNLLDAAGLTENEKFMMETIYLNNDSDEEVYLSHVAEMLHVSRERACQIYASALGKIRVVVMNNPDLRRAALDWEAGSMDRLEKAGYGFHDSRLSVRFKKGAANIEVRNPTVVDYKRWASAFEDVCDVKRKDVPAVDGHNGHTLEVDCD